MTSPLVVASVVEGHGEVEAFPIVLRRLVEQLEPNRWADVRRPNRVNRSTMLKPGQLERYLDLAALQHEGRGATFVLLDSDDDCAATLGPELLQRAHKHRPGGLVAVVLAVKEFEAWFLAAADSLAGCRGLPEDIQAPPDPESVRDAKGWLQTRRTDGHAYGPTVDQPALAASFDLQAARSRSRSFDKLWREVERLLLETGH
jgi:hypothetical protein